jgi:uncharacterized protein (DUF2062 family)
MSDGDVVGGILGAAVVGVTASAAMRMLDEKKARKRRKAKRTKRHSRRKLKRSGL